MKQFDYAQRLKQIAYGLLAAIISERKREEKKIMPQETVIAEEGTPQVGTRIEVSKDEPMEEGKIYEFQYSLTSLPLGWPIDKIRALILSKLTALIARFKGLRIIWWRMTENDFVFQAKGISESIWEQAALATVALAFQGLLLIWGLAIVLKGIYEITPLVKKYWWVYLLGGLGFIAIIFGWGCFKGKARQ